MDVLENKDFNLTINEISSIKDLDQSLIRKLISFKGFVKEKGKPFFRPSLAVFRCKKCKKFIKISQSSHNIYSGEIEKPSSCPECGGRSFSKLIEDQSEYKCIQIITLQNSLEEGKESIKVLLEDNLINSASLGELINVFGFLKFQENKQVKNGFNAVIKANEIRYIKPFDEIVITEDDKRKIEELASCHDIYGKIANSIFPSIHGYNEIKEAITLQLFGGSEKELEDKTRFRGDINILIVGDPGTGKSQMLECTSKIAPRGIYAVGTEANGLDLTARVMRDEVGGWSVKAGTLVLDHGLACIDGIHIKSEDEIAIKELLEKQKFDLVKKSIKETLNSNCSVLVAMHPKFGRFDRYKSIAEQINLSTQILSTFDIIYIIEDRFNLENDIKIAKHILSPEIPFEIDPELLKKYIAYARREIHPKLTYEATVILQKFYVDMRSGADDENSPFPITSRQLEALVRLSEARAKIRLEDQVTEYDAVKAIEIMQKCMKHMGYDLETGKVDINKVEGRMPKSERAEIRVVVEVIGELEDEYNGKTPKNVLISELGDRYNMSEEKIGDIIKILKRKCIIFEPANGYYVVA